MSKPRGTLDHTPVVCLVSSSGGHWEQLQRLQGLIDKYDGFYVTEKTPFVSGDPYLMIQTDLKDMLMVFKMAVNLVRAALIWVREQPDIVVTTGTLVAYPFYLLSRLFHKKFVFIETFGRSKQPTVAGKMMQKHADLFFVQWESQKQFYNNAIYVGCLY
ncbi:MAG: PssD/Cps14F family polysaccharide biosynthesis glycosyltransferase [Acidobacteriota bacterium]|nr:PssD/Cps14F family polysaccharide biosynthesis glycosyltransferase [Acidobacteriota bacterium]